MKTLGIATALIATFVLSTAAAAAGASVMTVRRSAVACPTLEGYNAWFKLAYQGDKQAATLFYLANRCILLAVGSTVYLMESSLWDGAMSIRQDGDTQPYWTAFATAEFDR